MKRKPKEKTPGELTPSRFQCSSDFMCGYMNFRPSDNPWSQVILLRCYLFSCTKLQPVNCCFQAPGEKKDPWRGTWDAHPSCRLAAAVGKVQDSILYLHASPWHWLLYFFIWIENQHWVNWMSQTLSVWPNIPLVFLAIFLQMLQSDS